MKSNKKPPYEKFSKKEMILRDHLAIDRTILANDRTFLSYIRTALAIIVAGAAVIHFSEEKSLTLGGLILAVVGAGVFVYGYMKYKKMDNIIRKSGEDLGE